MSTQWRRFRRDPLARASLLSVAFRFSSVFVSLLTGIVVARSLGAEGKGALAYLTTMVNFVARLTSFGVEASFTRFHNVKGLPAATAAGSVVWAAVGLGALGGGLVSLAVALLPALAASVPPLLVHATFWAMPAAMALFVLGPIMFGISAEVTFGALDLVMRLATLAVTVAVVGTAWNTLVSVGLLHQAVMAGSAVAGILLLARALGAPVRPHATTIRAMLADAPGTYAYNALRYLLGYGSTLLAAHLLGVGDAGVYSVALMLGESVTLVASSINMAFYPAVSRAGRPWDYARRVAGLVMALCAGIGLVLLAAAFWAVPWLYGPAFEPVAGVFMALLPGVVLLGGEQVVSSLFVAAGRPRGALAAAGAGVVLLPVFALPATAAAGIQGLALATSLAHAGAAAVVFLLFIRRAERFSERLS